VDDLRQVFPNDESFIEFPHHWTGQIASPEQLHLLPLQIAEKGANVFEEGQVPLADDGWWRRWLHCERRRTFFNLRHKGQEVLRDEEELTPVIFLLIESLVDQTPIPEALDSIGRLQPGLLPLQASGPKSPQFAILSKEKRSLDSTSLSDNDLQGLSFSGREALQGEGHFLRLQEFFRQLNHGLLLTVAAQFEAMHLGNGSQHSHIAVYQALMKCLHYPPPPEANLNTVHKTSEVFTKVLEAKSA
jgi:hypothetical protein